MTAPPTPATVAPGPVAAALAGLRDAVAGLQLGLELPEAPDARRSARSLVEQVDDYLLPRLAQLDAPLLAVVGGSTGAGKSTLVNSLLGAQVSPAGVLRPTTRAPVLVCSPDDRGWFSGDRVLPHLARVTGTGADSGPGTLRLVDLPQLPSGLALLDAPDVDSVVATNRDLAAQLLAAADLWLFVTTAARYADAVPWDVLRTAHERATALAVVLDRVPPEAVAEVAGDLRAMLARADLAGARLFVVEERPLQDGRLPDDQVRPVRDWLLGLAADAEARAAVVRQTLDGALDSLGARVQALTGAVARQEDAAQALSGAAEAAYRSACQEVDEGVRSGTLLRGEVLARWQDFVGTGEWMRNLESQIGRLRDRLTAAITGRSAATDEITGALESSVEQLLRAAADRAAERTVTAWRGTAGGPELLAGRDRELERVSPGFAEAAAAEVRSWQGYVLDLVRDEGEDKRSTARALSLGVNGAGLAVMIAVFAHTGGLTGSEVAVAGGTSAVGQRLLEAVFGDAAVRSLAARAREDLLERTDRLLTAERERFHALAAAAGPEPSTSEQLRAAFANLTAARRSGR
ncbi:MAG: dynamin family protein [Actinomycetota bacterium]|nr:dynamin family protein [Actinomycetota bacterium]